MGNYEMAKKGALMLARRPVSPYLVSCDAHSLDFIKGGGSNESRVSRDDIISGYAKAVFNYYDKKITSLTFSSKVDAKSISDDFISMTYLSLSRGPELNGFTSKIHRILLHMRRSFCVYLFLCLPNLFLLV